eukprot:1359075-Rhodomonas_salina.2
MSGDGDNEESLGSYAGRIAATLVKAFADEISRNTRWLVSLTAAAILLWRRDAIAVLPTCLPTWHTLLVAARAPW